jgi:hypothetical protein
MWQKQKKKDGKMDSSRKRKAEKHFAQNEI